MYTCEDTRGIEGEIREREDELFGVGKCVTGTLQWRRGSHTTSKDFFPQPLGGDISFFPLHRFPFKFSFLFSSIFFQSILSYLLTFEYVQPPLSVPTSMDHAQVEAVQQTPEYETLFNRFRFLVALISVRCGIA